MPSPRAVLRKARNQVRLLRDDPAKFGRNVEQYLHPERFRDRLLDVLSAPPLHVEIDDSLAPAVNVLRPPLTPAGMTGGPNTVLNLAFWLARQDVPVRLVTAPPGPGPSLDWFRSHLARLTGEAAQPSTLSVATAHDPAHPLRIGRRDMFLATFWTTAQQVKALLPRMAVPRFFYLIQDFEPAFYPWSSNYALALETYSLDHIGIFNSGFLQSFLRDQQVGRYADPAFARTGLAFEPAIDRGLFRPPDEVRRGPRRLLFYARPTNERNMLGLGLNALRTALADPAFAADWECLAIGSQDSLPALPLPGGRMLRPAPWADYASYAHLLQQSDILLCPMLSPHTSYPVLEMAACGGIAVTNSFAGKTAERLAAISPNIIGVAPTQDGFVHGLIAAAARVRDPAAGRRPPNLPADWRTALSPVAEEMAARFRKMSDGAADLTARHARGERSAPSQSTARD